MHNYLVLDSRSRRAICHLFQILSKYPDSGQKKFFHSINEPHTFFGLFSRKSSSSIT